jgi:tetratricopeptide (TPR) repeat protein
MSMTRDQMLQYLDDPSALNERTLGELREILNEFPFFQSAQLLYIRNLQNENNFRFAGQLKLCSVYATDRKILYQLLNVAPDKKRAADSSDENSQSELLNFELPNSAYSLDGIENETENSLSELVKGIGHIANDKAKEVKPEQKYDLIDRFIKDNPPFTIRESEHSGMEGKTNFQPDSLGGSDESSVGSDEFITETLARIYVKQGLYRKAVEAFEKLSLKYPEKSIYFARQIQEVINLLNK